MRNAKKLISVVICTHNRADLLTEALQTVCEQTLDLSTYEVIVVDNNSTDHTRQVTESFVQRYPNVRYLFAPEIGNSTARNVGWQQAEARYVAFTDDDCQLPSQWLMTAKAIIESVDPDVFGGPYFACYNTPKPYWFRDKYGSFEPHSTAKLMKNHENFSANNLFVKRQLLMQVGGFDPTFGMHGQQIGYGEENQLLIQIYQMMPDTRFYYDPALFVHHLVRPQKMSWQWIIREHFCRGRALYRITYTKNPQTEKTRRIIFFSARKVCRVVYALTIGPLLRKRDKFPYIQHYFFEETARQILKLGWRYQQYREHSGKI